MGDTLDTVRPRLGVVRNIGSHHFLKIALTALGILGDREMRVLPLRMDRVHPWLRNITLNSEIVSCRHLPRTISNDSFQTSTPSPFPSVRPSTLRVVRWSTF